MRCPYCQQNIRVQGRFCPKCGEQIFGLPVRPSQPGATPGGVVAPAPGTPPAEEGRGTSPRPTAPAPPPYQPFAQPPRHDYDDGLGIEVEAEPPPAAPSMGAATGGPPGAPHAAAREEIGKTCPYCRFPIKPSEQVVSCPACKLPHHADCWQENRGCTTYGCRGGAAAPSAPTHPPVVQSTLSPTGGTVPGVDYLRTNELAGRANNALILAILGL
ncbi:MAG: hypothetical protein KKI08_26590, partial [Armatimonadetes bacterium]|nr:hypothetical protein [Armatimonadota bacterium]